MVDKITYAGEFVMTDEIQKRFDEDGFIIIKDFFDSEEIAQMWKVLENPDGILQHSYETQEPDGHKILRVTYTHPGHVVSGIVNRSEKIVNSCEKVLKGSHKCGRIDHVPSSGTLQTGADSLRLEQLKKTFPLLYCEMDPGDVLFLHCNLLHTSSPNDSDMRRWAWIPVYNKKTNSSFIPHHHAQYTPLIKVADSEIKSCRNYTDFSGKLFINPLRDEKVKQTVYSYNLNKLDNDKEPK